VYYVLVNTGMHPKNLNFFIRTFWTRLTLLLVIFESDSKSTVYANVDPTLIADQRNFKAKCLQNGDENWTKKYIYLILAPSISCHISFMLI